jgi:hypothetical protein
MSGVDPLRQDFRMLTNDAGTPRVRIDPEYFITAQGPFIYYHRLVPETATRGPVNDGVWRVDTRLRPPRRGTCRKLKVARRLEPPGKRRPALR